MDFLFDPHIWAGLLTLVLLEVVLGIDNLVFIAILADKLPPHQRDKARVLGLSCALLMRLVLLAGISWVMSLQAELFSVWGHGFTGRDLILLLGGLFLLFKATSEIHERIEGNMSMQKSGVVYAGFAMVVTQIIVLDAVFSLDSVITAVGMVDDIRVMMIAVCVAMGLMIFASKPLTRFVLAHPTVIMLCLGFLLLVGFSLVAEGMGFHMPKGYLYAAIGFSVLIEAFNQTSTINRRRKALSSGNLRQKTADAVLRILGGKTSSGGGEDVGTWVQHATSAGGIFTPEEQGMIQGVLQMTERPIRAIMTPRRDVDWIDVNDDIEQLFQDIRATSHAMLLVCEGQVDNVVGILRKADLVDAMIDGARPDVKSLLRPPLVVHENISALRVLDMFKASKTHMAAVFDEYGSLEGIVTLTDIVEMLAGDMPESHEEGETPEIVKSGPDRYTMDAMVSIYDFGEMLGCADALPDDGDFTTLAGFLLHLFERLPGEGDTVTWNGWHFIVQQMDGNRIATVVVTREGAGG